MWETNNSLYFNVTYGVKKGGVISPILFCIYMYGMLNELSKNNVGFGFADDLKLLTPSVHALRISANICEKYAAKDDITFI